MLAKATRFINSWKETSNEPHFGHRGCLYSPTPSTSNDSSLSASRSSAASASSDLTQSFTCPSASDLNQSIRIVCSSATKHSISAESRIILAGRASDRNRKRRRIIGNGATDRPIGASKTATSNPRRAISARSDSRAASESDPPSVASFRSSPSFMLAYNFANRFRSFSGSGIVTVCAIYALDYSNPSEALLWP